MRHTKLARRLFASFAAFLAISLSLGCQNGPITGRMYQSQLESERLLSEFRAQKKENEQLREDRNKLLQQQAETEKLAARLQAQLSSSRSSGTNSQRGLADRTPSGQFKANQVSSDRSAMNGRSKTSSPGNGNDFDRNRSDQDIERNADETRSASNSDRLQWRPIRKATR